MPGRNSGQISTGDPPIHRRVLELPAPRLRTRRPAKSARRLDFIGRSRTYINSERRDAFIADIEKQRLRSASKWTRMIRAMRSISGGNWWSWRGQ